MVRSNNKRKLQGGSTAETISAKTDRKNAPSAPTEENEQARDMTNRFVKLFPDILYRITSMLDEVGLYSLEEAYSKEFKKPNISHRRRKELDDMAKYPPIPSEPENTVIPIFSGPTTRWLPKSFVTPSLVRGREFARLTLLAQEIDASRKSSKSRSSRPPYPPSPCEELNLEVFICFVSKGK
jgi:hypothetical protein